MLNNATRLTSLAIGALETARTRGAAIAGGHGCPGAMQDTIRRVVRGALIGVCRSDGSYPRTVQGARPRPRFALAPLFGAGMG
jgi:hypothetical protein